MRTFVLLFALSAVISAKLIFHKESDENLTKSGPIKFKKDPKPHYENPWKGGTDPECRSDEKVYTKYDNVGNQYAECAPKVDSKCPTDAPYNGFPFVTKPIAIPSNDKGETVCHLYCKGLAVGDCAANAICSITKLPEPINGVSEIGICMYKSALLLPQQFVAAIFLMSYSVLLF